MKPIVEVAILPAHAQSSPGSLATPPVTSPAPTIFSLSGSGSTPPSGTTLPTAAAINLVLTVTPNPGAGEIVDQEILRGGVPFASSQVVTDTNGQVVGNTNTSLCGLSNELRVRWTYMGQPRKFSGP